MLIWELMCLVLIIGLAGYVCHLVSVELARTFPRSEPLWWLRYAPYVALLFCLLWLSGSPS